MQKCQPVRKIDAFKYFPLNNYSYIIYVVVFQSLQGVLPSTSITLFSETIGKGEAQAKRLPVPSVIGPRGTQQKCYTHTSQRDRLLVHEALGFAQAHQNIRGMYTCMWSLALGGSIQENPNSISYQVLQLLPTRPLCQLFLCAQHQKGETTGLQKVSAQLGQSITEQRWHQAGSDSSLPQRKSVVIVGSHLRIFQFDICAADKTLQPADKVLISTTLMN